MKRDLEIVAFVIVVAVSTALGTMLSPTEVAAADRDPGAEPPTAASGSTPSRGTHQANYQADYHADYSVKGTDARVSGTDEAPARRDERYLQRDWRYPLGVDSYGRPLFGAPPR